LGDLLLGIPSFKALRARYPDDELVLYCRAGLGGLMRRLGVVDRTIEVDKSSPESLANAARELRGLEFETLFVPHESFRSAMLVAKVKAKRKIGYRRWFNVGLLADRVERPMHLPEALRQLALLAPLDPVWTERLASYASAQKLDGGQLSESELAPVPEWADMSVPALVNLKSSIYKDRSMDARISEKVRGLIGSHVGEIVCIAPGSVWPTKQWTRDGFASVASDYRSRGFKVFVLGAPDEKEVCGEVAASSGAISLAGVASLYESAEILALSKLLICNDSGAMHLAAAAVTPTISVFGPTVLEFGYRPWQNGARVVQVPRAELKCRPCGKHGAKTCPIGTHACMKNITTL
jgi:heptosyltransferase-2